MNYYHLTVERVEKGSRIVSNKAGAYEHYADMVIDLERMGQSIQHCREISRDEYRKLYDHYNGKDYTNE